MKKLKVKTLTLNCECAGGKKTCGYLKIIKDQDGDTEIIPFIKKNCAIFLLRKKGTKKLKKFL